MGDRGIERGRNREGQEWRERQSPSSVLLTDNPSCGMKESERWLEHKLRRDERERLQSYVVWF